MQIENGRWGDRGRTNAYHPLLAVAAAVGAGASVDRLLAVDWRLSLSAAALLLAARLASSGRETLQTAWLLAALAAAAAGGHHAALQLTHRSSLHLRLTSLAVPVVVRATALTRPLAAPAWRTGAGDDPLWTLRVRVTAIRSGTQWQAARGAAELSLALPAGQSPSLGAGDRLLLYCEARRHRPASNPGDWDPRQSTRTRRQCLLRAEPRGAIVERRAAWWSPRRVLAATRQRVESTLRRQIPAEQAGLAAALLLGRRELLDRGARDAFVESGTAHLLALSGLHVGLLAGIVWLAGRLGWLPRKVACYAAALTAIGYLTLAGPRASLVRATVLIAAVAGARRMGRPRAVWNTLSLAGLVLAVGDPTQLFDTGAQLSFMAVAALCRWGSRDPAPRPTDPLRRLIADTRPWPRRVARKAVRLVLSWLLVSAVVWMATAPVVAWRFGRLAPVGICLNPLMGPLVALALYAEVAVLATSWTGFTWTGLGGIGLGGYLGRVAGVLLQCTLDIAAWGASLPGGHFQLAPPPAAWAAVGCLLVLLWAILPPPRRWAAAAATAVWLAWAAAAQFPADVDHLQCTVLSVGHGTCIVIRTPDGQTAIYDAGRLGGGQLAARAAENCLRRLRVPRVDRLILSHEDADHYNAVPLLLPRVKIDRVCVGPRMLRATSDSGARRLADDIRRRRVPVQRWSDGMSQNWGEVRVDVLHPPSQWQGGAADNADSLVLRLSYRGRSILLTGDLEGEGLQRLMRRQRLTADVLLAPHHGSLRSHPLQLAERCGARWLIVSAGDSAKPVVWDEGRVLHTASDGAIQITIGAAGLTVRNWRATPW